MITIIVKTEVGNGVDESTACRLRALEQQYF